MIKEGAKDRAGNDCADTFTGVRGYTRGQWREEWINREFLRHSDEGCLHPGGLVRASMRPAPSRMLLQRPYRKIPLTATRYRDRPFGQWLYGAQLQQFQGTRTKDGGRRFLTIVGKAGVVRTMGAGLLQRRGVRRSGPTSFQPNLSLSKPGSRLLLDCMTSGRSQAVGK